MSNLTNQEVIEACEGIACYECGQKETCSVHKALYIDFLQPSEAGIATDDNVKFKTDKYYNGSTK